MQRLIVAASLAVCLIGVTMLGAPAGEKKEQPPKKPNPVFTDDKEAGENFQIQGEYVGKHGDHKVGAQVIAQGRR